MLSLPEQGEPLTLYLVGSNSSISVVLALEKEGDNLTQSLIYYLSRALVGVEHRYPPIEKLALAIVVVIG